MRAFSASVSSVMKFSPTHPASDARMFNFSVVSLTSSRNFFASAAVGCGDPPAQAARHEIVSAVTISRLLFTAHSSDSSDLSDVSELEIDGSGRAGEPNGRQARARRQIAKDAHVNLKSQMRSQLAHHA